MNALIDIIERERADDDAQKAPASSKARIDAVLISFEFTDHMHKETLLQVHPTVPVIASKKASTNIVSWKHFRVVIEIPTFPGGNWRELMSGPLPAWIRIAKLGDPFDPYPGLNCAFVIISNDIYENKELDESEAIVYTPHGISPDGANVLAISQPQIHTIPLMHGLDVVKLPMMVNMGAHNGLKVQRALRAKYWVATHDEAVPIQGIVGHLVRREPLTIQDAVRQESENNSSFENENAAARDLADNSGFKDLRNGMSMILI